MSRTSANVTIFLIVMILLVITACNKETRNQVHHEGTTPPVEANAAALYKKQCLSCHAADLSGKVGPDLRGIGSKMAEKQLFEIIHDGAKGMPAFKKSLSKEEMEALAQWLAANKS
ncbi:Cytochrome c-551 [Paenibacillus sp. CECT 9249]|uniref:c-type cytochrome n=1 Tax=Paenibacillus sp. CECT 9249 TaxID=2845385 RepID=UPI001E4581F9|nr:cytochrome c [Paenibacillus sp. CECT 9249]CAH0120831.1 Cytochrome c-551 [Paenibacillus sp. CECT 9249]